MLHGWWPRGLTSLTSELGFPRGKERVSFASSALILNITQWLWPITSDRSKPLNEYAELGSENIICETQHAVNGLGRVLLRNIKGLGQGSE